jgi:hypothetical protein
MWTPVHPFALPARRSAPPDGHTFRNTLAIEREARGRSARGASRSSSRRVTCSPRSSPGADVPGYTPRERAASLDGVPDARARDQGAPRRVCGRERDFTPRERVAPTLAIIAINGWSRLSIGPRRPGRDYVSHRRPEPGRTRSALRVERHRQRIGRVWRGRRPVQPRCVSPARRAPTRGAEIRRPRTRPPGTAAGRASGTHRSVGRGQSRSRPGAGGDGRGRDTPTRRSARGR